ncbi:MAG: hypothetical protein AAGI01_08110, partial [Myxococcota bacterium]
MNTTKLALLAALLLWSTPAMAERGWSEERGGVVLEEAIFGWGFEDLDDDLWLHYDVAKRPSRDAWPPEEDARALEGEAVGVVGGSVRRVSMRLDDERFSPLHG